ncbi:MAG: right-handed parallel beta-helix repeat-containing protein [Anaerolineae bacterium]
MNRSGLILHPRRMLVLTSALVALALLGLAVAAGASTRSNLPANSPISVNTLDDGADTNANDCLCATDDNLCSLRAALQTANACPGADLIQFAISGTIAPYYSLPALSDSSGGTTIDGYSAPGASPNTAPLTGTFNASVTVALDGRDLAFDGLTVTSHHNVVRGLAIYGFDANVGAPYYNGIVIAGGRENLIAGNFLGLTADGSQVSSFQRAGVNVRALAKQNVIGGTLPADRNVISGNRFAGVRIEGNLALTNTVQGNLIGPALDGASVLTNSQQLYGVHLTNIAYDNLVLDNVISGNSVAGVVLSDSAGGNLVRGNIIGPAAGGEALLAGSVQSDGVWINTSASNNLVQANLISGNRANGVRITGSGAFRNRVWANTIGPAAAGGPLPGSVQAVGVRLSDGATSNEIGSGADAAASNRIAYHTLTAVTIEGNSPYNRVRRNNLADNGPSLLPPAAPGLDLGADGITPDDPGDGDGGPNSLQNRPLIGNISALINQIQLDIFVDSSPEHTQYPLTIDFYRAEASAVLGQVAAGQAWVGSLLYESTQTTITQRFPAAVIPNDTDLIVATVTDASGNTSEFSQATALSQNAFAVTNLGDSADANVGDCLCATTDAGCTLRAALEEANACSGPHAIGFLVAGVIVLTSPLPALTDPAGLWIDGTTAPGARVNTAALSSPIDALLTITLSGNDQLPDGLILASDNNRINGLVLTQFTNQGVVIQGSANLLTGNFIGVAANGISGAAQQQVGIAIENGAADNQIGGTMPADRNLISSNLSAGIIITGAGSDRNIIIGNSIGPSASGSILPDGQEQQIGVWIGDGAQENRIGVTASLDAASQLTGSSNLISGNRQAGIYLGPGSSRTQVMNNTIGPAASGQSIIFGSAQADGIVIEGASDNQVGRLGQANQVSGNDQAGVRITGATASHNLILANLIGPARSGTTPLTGSQQQHGIVIEEGAHDNQVGDTAGSLIIWPGNVVRFNSQEGIVVTGEETLGNRLSGNIVVNGPGRAIDLDGDGLTPNDEGDPDLGPNRRQNYPSIATVLFTDPDPGVLAQYEPILISYRVDSAVIYASYPITVEFYRADSMTSGQALSYLGATSYTFNVAQNITSVLLEPVQAANLWWPMVATATDRNGNTSELSDPFCPGAYPDVDRSGSVDIVDIMLVAHLIGRSAYLYDANCDGFLDVTDLATLVTAWQSCLAANTPPGQAPVACR